MRVIADLQIHSKYSRATSANMRLDTIAYNAKIKGLSVVGTGDATHPKWLQEVSETLEPDGASGLYRPKAGKESDIRFIITAEVSTVYSVGSKARRIHHVILLPSIEIAYQAVDRLSKFGDLKVDGRPTLNIPSPELVENLVQISSHIEIFPAHAWTPWYSVFGANNGFDSIEECYGDQLDHIHALETGLSSDPLMNWRLSSLDRFTLLSNSDSHSPYPYRLGREAVVFEMDDPSYFEIVDAIRKKDKRRLVFTIETKPEYGKYHWTGHRQCGVSMPATEAVRHNSRCPKCGRMMTRGVEQRVEQLADRPMGYKAQDVPSYVYLLPLHEILAAVSGHADLLSQRVQKVYQRLIEAFGTEFAVTLDAPVEAIAQIAGLRVANAVQMVRNDTLKVVPGYDGVYGRIEMPEAEREATVQGIRDI